MSVKGDYLKHKETLIKHGKFSVAAAIVSLVALLVLVFLPCFKIMGIFSFSLLDEIELVIDFISKIIKNGFSSSTMELFNFYSIILIFVILVNVIRLIILSIKTIVKMSNQDMYTMEVYDKIVHRSENKKEKMAGPWDGFYATIAMIIVDILIVRMAFNISGSDFIQYGGSVSNLIFVDGISIWGILVIAMLVAVIVLHVLASSQVRTVKKAVIKAEYEEKQAALNVEASKDDEPFEENK